MKSKATKVFGGFTQVNWKSSGGYQKDEIAFIYSIDRKQIYRVVQADQAIYCGSSWGPNFGAGALGVAGDPLNKEDNGDCWTNGYSNGAIYGIKSDIEGNHEVTGEGHKQKNDAKRFTCVELEVYGVKFQQ